MTIQAIIRALDEVARHLPFPVGDYARANAVFVRWRETSAERDRQLVDLWIYCYTRRYYLVKAFRYRHLEVNDIDALVEQSFNRVHDRLDRINNPEAFASWVSVVCRNTFVNYLRSFRPTRDLDHSPPLAENANEAVDYDRFLLNRLLETAITRLPPFLVDIARMRFLEGKGYEEMEAVTGLDRPKLRAYVHKVALRFREEPAFQAYLDAAGDY